MVLVQFATWPEEGFSRLAKIVIVPSAAASRPDLARTPAAAARELATMATTYHDNVSSPVPTTREAPP
jgi:hypothetical protein